MVCPCRAVGYQFEVVATEDGANGTVLAWSDSRSSPDYAIYAQRLSSAGAALWDTSAVAMVVPPTSASYPCVVSDGAGGAIVAWEAFSASQIFVKVQRVSASGAVLFGTTGVRLSNGPGSENNVCIASMESAAPSSAGRTRA